MSYCLEQTQICYQGYWEREVCSPCASPSLSVAYALEETLFKKFLTYSAEDVLREVRLETPQGCLLDLNLEPVGSYKLSVEMNNK